MATFDNQIMPIPVKRRPGVRPATGDKDKVINTIIYEHTKGENDRPHFNVKFRGLVLYTTVLDYEAFEAKYDKTFIDFCTGASPRATGKADGKSEQTSNLKIIEAIVYIQELCACLPQPNSDVFFKQIKKLNEKPAKGKEGDALRKESQNSKISAKQLEQIRRYPKAYLVLRSGTKEIKPQEIVDVVFMYNFDYSYGTIITQAPA